MLRKAHLRRQRHLHLSQHPGKTLFQQAKAEILMFPPLWYVIVFCAEKVVQIYSVYAFWQKTSEK